MSLLVISTWGFSGSWKRVTYRLDDLRKVLETPLSSEVISCNVLKLFKGENIRRVILLPITLLDTKVNNFEEAEDVIRNSIIASNPDDNCKRDLEEILHDSQVKVVLGSGYFLSNTNLNEFIVPFSSVLSDIYLKIYESLEEAYNNPRSELRIILDITHGVNYYPVSLRAVVEKMLAIMSHRGRTKLYVASSDPFISSRNSQSKDIEKRYLSIT